MKITRTETTILRIPEDDPLADTPENPTAAPDRHPADPDRRRHRGHRRHLLRRRADRHAAHARSTSSARCRSAKTRCASRRSSRKLRAAAGRLGPGGIFTLALSAIDIALWDIRGKALGPAAVEAARRRARARADLCQRRAAARADARRRSSPPPRRLKDKGFREMKTQLALPGDTIAGQGGRAHARVMREAIGPDIKLMCDINQRWRVGAGDRHRPAGRGCRGRPLLARGRDDARRLCRARARHRGAVDAGRRRRIRLGHRAVPPHDRGALGRLSSMIDLVPRRRHHANG